MKSTAFFRLLWIGIGGIAMTAFFSSQAQESNPPVTAGKPGVSRSLFYEAVDVTLILGPDEEMKGKMDGEEIQAFNPRQESGGGWQFDNISQADDWVLQIAGSNERKSEEGPWHGQSVRLAGDEDDKKEAEKQDEATLSLWDLFCQMEVMQALQKASGQSEAVKLSPDLAAGLIGAAGARQITGEFVLEDKGTEAAAGRALRVKVAGEWLSSKGRWLPGTYELKGPVTFQEEGSFALDLQGTFRLEEQTEVRGRWFPLILQGPLSLKFQAAALPVNARP
jgi:hypothetical protein